jgi:hypothetical protein
MKASLPQASRQHAASRFMILLETDHLAVFTVERDLRQGPLFIVTIPLTQ